MSGSRIKHTAVVVQFAKFQRENVMMTLDFYFSMCINLALLRSIYAKWHFNHSYDFCVFLSFSIFLFLAGLYLIRLHCQMELFNVTIFLELNKYTNIIWFGICDKTSVVLYNFRCVPTFSFRFSSISPWNRNGNASKHTHTHNLNYHNFVWIDLFAKTIYFNSECVVYHQLATDQFWFRNVLICHKSWSHRSHCCCCCCCYFFWIMKPITMFVDRASDTVSHTHSRFCLLIGGEQVAAWQAAPFLTCHTISIWIDYIRANVSLTILHIIPRDASLETLHIFCNFSRFYAAE